MTTLEAILDGIVADPDPARWLVLADWLEEYDDPRRAELLRLHRRLVTTCCKPGRHPDRAAWQARIVELLAQGVKPCVPQRSVLLADGVEMVFTVIPPGSFLMGSPEDEEERNADERQHRVTLTRGFYLGVHQVTRVQWHAVMSRGRRRLKGDPHRPTEGVSWDDCLEFCRALGEQTGQRFRLPTEAEWEYACRAGTTTPFFLGDTISPDQASYDGKRTYGNGRKGVSRRRSTAVGSFPPNAWGLFDLHGNLWEWCHDLYGPYSSAGTRDPQGGRSGTARVLRGGCWYNGPENCRSANRFRDEPRFRQDFRGCRVCLCLD
jgi:uncharacterized protein (TIGR02996 family)